MGAGLLALVAFLAASPSGGPNLPDQKEIRHEDVPPARRNVKLKPVQGLGAASEGASSWTGLAADRFGTVFYLRNLRNFLQIDSDGNVERVAIRELPEKFLGARIWTFSFGDDGQFHLFADVDGPERSWVITVDKKGRFERATPLPITLLMASGAVTTSGDILVSVLYAPALDTSAPAAPLIVYDKKGQFKKTLGRWLDPAKDPQVDAGSNARIVRLDPEGWIILASRDRYRLEVLRPNGDLARVITVEAASPPESPRDEREEKAKAPEKGAGGIDGQPSAKSPAVEAGVKGSEGKKVAREIEVEDVIRDVAFHKNRIYVLRAPPGSGAEAAVPAIDVFDTNGKWEEQLLLQPGSSFTSLAIDPFGVLYLCSSGKTELLSGDLAEGAGAWSPPKGAPSAASPSPGPTNPPTATPKAKEPGSS